MRSCLLKSNPSRSVTCVYEISMLPRSSFIEVALISVFYINSGKLWLCFVTVVICSDEIGDLSGLL